jgi:uncharacterized protein
MDGRVFMPADQFVLKVNSRCDLACDHCYVYESADQSWHGRPIAVSPEVVSRTAQRIAEHVKTHELDSVEVVLHGGEPLLCGVAGLRRILGELAATLGGLCRLDLRVHTNGVLLTEKFCELFDSYGVHVGISLDGDRAANDRHRRYRDGRSSYDQAVRAAELLGTDRFRHLYAGLLCTIDVANDPIAVYESLLRLSPPRIDFLLPHATWDSPPARTAASGTDYADWLIEIFDRWQADGNPVGIRTFDSIIATLAGGESSTEALGLAPVAMVVIETDGTYEQADSLKVAYGGAPETGLDVFRHSLDAVIEHPGVAARQRGLASLSATCRQCPVVTSCGGGMYAHRYRSGSQFDNPSVYCGDLIKLIEHVKDTLPHVTPALRSATHVISDGALAELAAGLGGAEAIGQLTQAQRSLRRALLTAVYHEGVSAPVVPVAVRERMRAAWQVLAVSDGDRLAAPGDLGALDSVLGHPYLRAWAVRCLERLRQADGDGRGSGVSLAADLGHLGAIAAAVAIRGQARARVAVPVTSGAVHLPGLGRLVIEPAAAESAAVLPGADARWALVEVDADWVRVRVGADGMRLPRPSLLAGEHCRVEPCEPDGTIAVSSDGLVSSDGIAAGWEPVRVLAAPGIRVALEDIHPYRDCHQWPAAPRLTDAEFARWQDCFALAWREIQANHRAYGPALAAGLGVLTPMLPATAGQDVGSAARQAFGAVAAALPADPVTMALLLIREFQHVKLGAVLDLFDLCDPADKRLYQAPWRTDVRPLEWLLRGAYARLAVSEFWRVRARLGEDDQWQAARRYEHSRADTATAIGMLASAGSLTPLGERVVDQMRTAISAQWLS